MKTDNGEQAAILAAYALVRLCEKHGAFEPKHAVKVVRMHLLREAALAASASRPGSHGGGDKT